MNDGKCAFIKPGGVRCGAYPLAGRLYCAAHETDPEIIALVRQQRSKGGRSTASRKTAPIPPELLDVPPLTSPTAVHAFIERVLALVLAGAVSPNVGNACARLCDSKLRLAELELNARVAALEQRINELRSAGRLAGDVVVEVAGLPAIPAEAGGSA